VGSRRTIILIAAIVVGAIAAFALYTYVGGIEDEANDNARRVDVYKVVKDIPKGFFGDEAFEQGYVERDQIPAEFKPASSVTSADQINALVAINTIPANQVITTDMFTTQQASLTTFASLLKENQVSVTVSVDQVRGVAGLLVPGDVVNMLVLAEPIDAQGNPVTVPPGTTEGDYIYDQVARYLYQKVQILAIGQTKQLQPGETASTAADGSAATPASGLITFAVPPEAAQRIVSVSGGGETQIYLSLVPRDYVPVPLPPHDAAERLPGEDPARLTPYGPAGLEDN
jgi:pilus assembly protein CpaB